MKENIRLFVLTFLFLCLFSFLFMGMWEWMQSPFFKDFTDDFNKIVLFRIHCTLGDILILLEIGLIRSLMKRSWRWILHPNKADYFLVILMGVAYTIFSEYMNVYVRRNWGYSELMPLIPIIGVGLVPVLQWTVLPWLILSTTKNHLKGYTHSSHSF